MPDRSIVIDGSQGEGGGQVLRTAVSLAAALGREVTVTSIRAGRPKPGLAAQHVAAVRAAAAVCDADVAGDEIASTEVTFRPGPLRPGSYRFDIGTAGSTTLVLQTVIPALMLADDDSEVTVSGGTHNPLAPCFEYLRDVFAVLASTMNLQAYFVMERPGFFPAGGGKVAMQIRGVEGRDNLEPLRLGSRGELRYVEGLSGVGAKLPAHVGDRQARTALQLLARAGHRATFEEAVWETASPGTVVFLRAAYSRAVAGFFCLGQRGRPAEQVARDAVEQLLGFIDSPGVVDPFAADQLLTLAALCPYQSTFVTQRATGHLRTNAAVVRLLTGREVVIEEGPGPAATVTVAGE